MEADVGAGQDLPDATPATKSLGTAANAPYVVVIMSTYQGERYVREQMQSVLSQLPARGTVLVRDDGSTDRTVDEIVALADPRITITTGRNLGFGPSFLTLLTLVPKDVDMVMLADQDDVWLPDKLQRAWEQLSPLDSKPGLYGSAQTFVDQDLRPLGRTPLLPRGPSFANALTENIIVGCTAALNRAALQLLQRAGVPSAVRFHDWWIYLVVSAFGVVVYDEEPALLYRQHGANVIGRHPGRVKRLQRAWKVIVRDDWVGSLLSQIHAFFGHYGELLSSHDRSLITQHFANYKNAAVPRWAGVFSLHRRHQSLIDDVVVRCLLALRKMRPHHPSWSVL